MDMKSHYPKVIQITTGAGVNIEGNTSHWLYALCDDGSIWQRAVTDRNWDQITTPAQEYLADHPVIK